jgi:glyoxylase-like metal-dependent hydrolase (beta-lactamase superfamily II)
VRAISLHRDVLVVTSQLLQVNCTIVRGPARAVADGPSMADGPVPADQPGATEPGRNQPGANEPGAIEPGAVNEPVATDEAAVAEAFVIDSPVLPEELELLPSLLEQAEFPKPQGLLVTHADWDHVLGPLAFPEAALGCAESSAARLSAEPGAAQRELRDFDEELYLTRHRPLSLASIQPLAVPGRCGIGDAELELHPTDGHTADGMAVAIPWARVLVAGDYLSSVELPALNAGDRIDAYLVTLELLGPLVTAAEQVVPGLGPILDRDRALAVLDEDASYLRALRERGSAPELPAGRRGKAQRELHARNLAALTP